MTEPTVTDPPAATPPPPTKSLPPWAWTVGTVAAMLALTAVIVFHTTFTMHGTLSGSCGYGDPGAGDEVTVYNASGTIIGHTTLVQSMGIGYSCTHSFTVEGLPNFESAYSIQISKLSGRVTYDRDKAEYPAIAAR